MDLERASEFFTPNYKPAEFLPDRAEGSFIYDTNGNRYLDFSSGIAVNNLGHCHPQVVEAIQKQSAKLLHTSNLFWNEQAIRLSEVLCKLSFADQVFFTNSGTESNEAAFKLARKYFYDQGKPRSKIVAFENGFHGRTAFSLSATAKKKYKEPFAPLVPGFEFAKFNDIESLSIIDDQTAAVVVEPVQGEGGVFPATDEFLNAVRKRCDQTGALLIFDSIQVGIYRTGCLFGYESYEVTPDIMSLAKALGGGMPIGAMLTKKEVGKSFGIGAHGSTFGGNPVCAAAANAVLDVVQSPEFQEQLCSRHGRFNQMIEKIRTDCSQVQSVRSRGMMLGIDLKTEANPVYLKLRKQKVLVTRIFPRTLRILPPLNASDEEIELFEDNIIQVLQ